jgi:hypothetical protein
VVCDQSVLGFKPDVFLVIYSPTSNDLGLKPPRRDELKRVLKRQLKQNVRPSTKKKSR